jgi:tetratricopeptide (TPR) repeat protein
MVKQLRCLIILLSLFPSLSLAQSNADSAKLARAVFIKGQTVKADSLNTAALKLAQANASPADLNKAIENIMAGLHVYSKFRDTVGLRETFDHLALVYHLQKKYTQAKWFFIQSNSLSRDGRDTINIITSLINLASVKEDIKDFSLAKRDLTEALLLAKTRPKVDEQIEVQKALAEYYTKKGDAPAAAMALNRVNYLKDSIVKRIAQQKTQLTVANPTEKQDTLHITDSPVNEEQTMHNGEVITIITLITAALAGICILFYLRSKKRNK